MILVYPGGKSRHPNEKRKALRNKMVVRLSGGLGNQLFQYATGLAAADANRLEVFYYWDKVSVISAARGIKRRKLELDEISVSLDNFLLVRGGVTTPGFPFTGKRAIRSLSGRPVSREFARDLGAVLNNPIIQPKETPGKYMPSFRQITSRGGHLIGYWQSAKYFERFQLFFHQKIRQTEPICALEGAMFRELESIPTIAVHVRRGDYVTSATASKTHGVLQPSYFERGIRQMVNETGIDRIWFFSEDIEFCRDEINLPRGLSAQYFSPTTLPLTSARQMCLMSKASAFVISNSSYSWWAAWSSLSDKVLAPDRWAQSEDLSFKDTIPSDWQKIQATFRP
jgi:hypothetical protein